MVVQVLCVGTWLCRCCVWVHGCAGVVYGCVIVQVWCGGVWLCRCGVGVHGCAGEEQILFFLSYSGIADFSRSSSTSQIYLSFQIPLDFPLVNGFLPSTTAMH